MATVFAGQLDSSMQGSYADAHQHALWSDSTTPFALSSGMIQIRGAWLNPDDDTALVRRANDMGACLFFATLVSTLRVPFTAGSTSSFWGSEASLKKGNAVWKTKSAPLSCG